MKIKKLGSYDEKRHRSSTCIADHFKIKYAFKRQLGNHGVLSTCGVISQSTDRIEKHIGKGLSWDVESEK